MRDQQWQIAIFGTFDVQNYGDLLFPLIAEAELTERLGAVTLHRFSYQSRRQPEWPYHVTSLEELPGKMAGFDGALIGGGFIIRFDKYVAPGYGPSIKAIHHPTGYWLSPALIALQHNVPLMWNAPGMHCNDIPEWAEPLVKLALEHSQYIAVRDTPTQIDLSRFVDIGGIELVPDTGFGVSRLVDMGHPSAGFIKLRESSSLRDPYVIVQSGSIQNSFWRFAKQHSSRLRDLRFLSLPISPIFGDEETNAINLPGLVRLPAWPEPLLLAELISHATAVVGHSYHLAITALSFGVPVFSSANLSEGKYTALADFETVYPFTSETEMNIDSFIARLEKAPPSPNTRLALDRLVRHWDRVATILREGPTSKSAHLDRSWQSLPTLLESAYERTNEIQAAADVRSNELKELLELARSEIVTRDERLATMRNSPSWQFTAPLRFIMRNLKRVIGYSR